MKYSQSVCALNLLKCEQQIDDLVKNGLEYMHLDFMDFHYTSSFGLNMETADYLIKKYPNVQFDAHCMTSDVELLLKKFNKIKIQRVSFPLRQASVVKLSSYRTMFSGQLGVMIESQDEIMNYVDIIKNVDFIVLMTIDKIGGTGVQLNPELLNRVKVLKQINPKLFIISDGGLRENNADLFHKAKVDVAVGGSIINTYSAKDKVEFMTWWNEKYGL